MISAEEFARSYSSYWRVLLPLEEVFVRLTNLRPDAFASRLPTDVASDRRALVAEVGFVIFARRVQRVEFTQNDLTQVRARLERLRGRASVEKDPSTAEMQEARQIADRIEAYFRGSSADVVVGPRIPGCGLITDCEADVLTASSLYEVKTVDRPFRGSDFRQLLAYCALNYASGRYAVDSVGLLNPRRGISFVITLDQLCYAMAGVAAVDFCADFVSIVSTSGMSP